MKLMKILIRAVSQRRSPPVRIFAEKYTTQTQTEDTTKPEGWDTAKPYHTIPGPKGLPFIGNTWRFFPLIGNLYGRDSLDMSQLFNTKYGKISLLSGIPLPDMVIISAPEDIEWLFRNEGIYPIRATVSKSFAIYRKNVRPELFKGFGAVAEVHGEAWHAVRSKLNPIMMQPKSVLQYAKDMDKIANQLIDKMRYYANSNPQREMPDDFQRCLYAWTLESIMFICLDKQLGCLDQYHSKDSQPSKLIDSALEMFKLFRKIETQPSTRNIYKTKMWRRYVELMDFLTFTFLEYLEEAISNNNMKQSSEETTILKKLLKIDKVLAMTTTIDLLTGGVDTTGKVTSSTLYYLAKTPNAQNKLRDELIALLPNKDSPVTKEVLSKASYLRAVIKEATRLAPIAAVNLRTTTKDMVICGYQIPKGTNIYTANLLLSQSEEHYKHAMEFVPERWLRTTTDEFSAKSVNPFITLPFGYGPRSCLGKRLAMLELEIAIAKVVRNFYLEWHYKDATFKLDPFCGIADPLKFRIHEVE